MELENKANSYFVPYLVFIRDYIDKIIDKKNDKVAAHKEDGLISDVQNELMDKKKEICKFL